MSKQSMTDLRALAQSRGVEWAFSDDRETLSHKIDTQDKTKPVITPSPPRNINNIPKKLSITELRALAQNMGCRWTFNDSYNILQQKIALKQTELLPPVNLPLVPVPEDQRLRSKPPSKVSTEEMIRTLLAPYIQLGLEITFDDGKFHMKFKERTDSGTLRQQPRVILDCAKRLLQ